MKKAFLLLFLLGSSAYAQKNTYQVGQIKTSMGEILVWLYDDAPKHKKAFIELAEEGYWSDYTFNRVIENFVAQGGCPDVPEGFAYSVHLLEPEFEAGHKHVYGAFGAGRDDNPGKLSAACQFYIVQNKDGIPRLDGDYMIYGQVIKGMDVVDKMVKVEKDKSNKPLTPITMEVNVIKMKRRQIEALGFEIPKIN
ncbi:peptidylprolyl isomerase [Roseivirga misakiensis]|uniref:Peptidyl-prolyl cis-trans isomerase n=1 Tax=Roseivirga misakiensis TaxID=1563681 RepID=A0A1E5T2K8_9BACT|nr:peptidylprolyl isomerase [Roseivirga misakiensis]OEK05614.1 peptidylprolyl isomerase [Roseivirga misakiensis]